jgi:hypothetical protein
VPTVCGDELSSVDFFLHVTEVRSKTVLLSMYALVAFLKHHDLWGRPPAP